MSVSVSPLRLDSICAFCTTEWEVYFVYKIYCILVPFAEDLTAGRSLVLVASTILSSSLRCTAILNGTTTVAISTFWLAQYCGQHPLYPDLSYRIGCSTPLANQSM